MHEKKIARIYNRELLGALAIYAILLVVTIKYGRGMEDGVLRTIVLLSPMAGFGLGVWAIARQFGRTDEFVRKSTLENIAFAAAMTAGLSFSYGFLETAGYPRLSMFAVWPVMGASWLLAGCVRALMNRE